MEVTYWPAGQTAPAITASRTRPATFIGTWNSGDGNVTVETHDEDTISSMIDGSDLDMHDGLIELYAIGADGKLHAVRPGKREHDISPLVTDDGVHVGDVHHTDH
jgi:hypothetical protein